MEGEWMKEIREVRAQISSEVAADPVAFMKRLVKIADENKNRLVELKPRLKKKPA